MTSYTTSRCQFIITVLLQFASHLFAFTVACSLIHVVCLIQVEVVARNTIFSVRWLFQHWGWFRGGTLLILLHMEATRGL
uniref:Uncharacterized protein n=1 Tax=Arundo donax TaxID=35708 RepID=A0A0A9FR55_ARUDO